MSAQGALTREEIQTVSDMRLIALSLIKRWDDDKHRAPNIAGVERIIAECEDIIRRGPEAFHFVLEPSASLALVEHELRRSVFGRGRGRGMQL